MGPYDIKKALTAKLERAATGLIKNYPNVKPEQPDDAPYADVSFVPNQPVAVTVGTGGEDEHTGFMQVMLRYPLGEGDKRIMTMAQDITNAFVGGTKCHYKDQSVTITSSGPGTPKEYEGRFNLPITIAYYARTRR